MSGGEEKAGQKGVAKGSRVAHVPSSNDLCELRVAGAYAPDARSLRSARGESMCQGRGEGVYAPVNILIPLPVNMLHNVHETNERK